MSRLIMGLVIANLGLLLWSFSERSTYAQRPPELNAAGEAYLRVNINPTPIPPMVNINPEGQVPRIEVTKMPEIPPPPLPGCDNPRNFETGVSRSISGPMRVTFLNTSQTTPVNFVDSANRSYRVTLSATAPFASIYLRSDQKLEFDSAMLYSGCRS